MTAPGYRPPPATRRRAALVVTVLRVLSVLLTSSALTGCAGLPTPVAPPSQDHPVVTPDQAQRISAAATEVVTRVTGPGTAWNRDLAATRLTGPAAQWAAFSVPAGHPVPVGLSGPAEPGVLIAPRATQWPRAFAIVGGEPEMLHVYVSDSARTPFRLWAAMPVLEPAALPAFGPADAGVVSPLAEPSPAVAATTGGAADSDGERSMADVVSDLPTRYVDVLSAGDASVHAPEFEADGVAAALRARVEDERSRLAAVARTDVSHQVSATADQPGIVLSALAANGDALVVAAFATTVTSTVTSTAGFTVPEQLAGPAGTTEVRSSLSTQSVAALAFVVPATTGNIQVVAAADSVTGVTAAAG